MVEIPLSIALFMPLIGFLFLVMASWRIGRGMAGVVASSTVLISFISFALLLYLYTTLDMPPQNFTLYHWISLPSLNAPFTLHLDPLSLLMALLITGVGFLIHVYSIGYMEDEPDFARYFACLNFFIFAMLLLVLAENLLLLFVGWEGVGLASYLLIGFWYRRPEAAKAATKAFIVNRIGDLGLLLGILLTFYIFGTGNIPDLLKRAEETLALDGPLPILLSSLFLMGAIGKSAQLPLHVWLPDAMEGPTPVSALIHAATMVTAGVYLVVRLHPLFELAPTVLQCIGILGASTALFAALAALGQTDLKRVLAYSTISQLGLMFLACGVSAFYAAMFHLTMHAFVKALLFLSAGNVVHMLHGKTEMETMGGLAKIFTKTHWLFLIGVLAMSGIPPLSAFFSKDLILEEEYLAGFKTLFYVGLMTSILTAIYLTRAYIFTFLGSPRSELKKLANVKEAPSIMVVPVTFLAFLSIVGGFIGFSISQAPLLEKFLAEVDVTFGDEELEHGFMLTPETWLAIGGAFFGVALAALIYTRFRSQVEPPLQILKKAFFFDLIYEKALVNPLRVFSSFIARMFEPYVFDGSVRLLAQGTKNTAYLLQRVQNGEIRSYAAWMVIGSVLLMAYLIF